MTRADELALDLLSEGITGMKIWPFDYVAHMPGRVRQLAHLPRLVRPRPPLARRAAASTTRDLDRGLEPFRKIRAAVGDKMEIMVEGHGFWSLPAAKKIAQPWRSSALRGSKT